MYYAALDVDDIPALLPIEQAAHLYPWHERVFQDCFRSGYRLDGVYVDPEQEALMGFSVAMVVLDEWHLLNLCVAPQYQRRGVGRYLMQRLFVQAEQLAADRMFLEVRQSNQAAIRLYRSLGFEDIGHRRDYYPAPTGREDARVMRRFMVEST